MSQNISFLYIHLAATVLEWNVTMSNPTATSVTLHWTKLSTDDNQYAEFYIVDVKSIEGIIFTVDIVYGNTTTTIIKGLRPSTEYHFSVFGVDGTGQPYKSIEVVATTDAGIG